MADGSAGGMGGLGDTAATARSRRQAGSKSRLGKDTAISTHQKRVDEGVRNRHRMYAEKAAAAVAWPGSERTSSGTLTGSSSRSRDRRGSRPLSGGGLWSGSNFPRGSSDKPAGRFGIVAQQPSPHRHLVGGLTSEAALPQSLAAAAAALRIPRSRVLRRQDSEHLAILSSDGDSSCSAETDDDYDYEDEVDALEEEREFSRLDRNRRLVGGRGGGGCKDGECFFRHVSDDPCGLMGHESTLLASDAAACGGRRGGGCGSMGKPGSQVSTSLDSSVASGTRAHNKAESGLFVAAAGDVGDLVVSECTFTIS